PPFQFCRAAYGPHGPLLSCWGMAAGDSQAHITRQGRLWKRPPRDSRADLLYKAPALDVIRRARTLKLRYLSGIPFRGDRSDTLLVPNKPSSVSGIPRSGDRSDTGRPSAMRMRTLIPWRGDRSDTCEPLQFKCVSGVPTSGDKSDTEVPLQNRVVRGIPF